MSTRLRWRLRRIGYLLQRLRLSLAMRGWRATLQRIGREFEPRTSADAALDVLPLDDSFAPFVLPVSAIPRVSVIVPAYGKRAHTVACLRSIARHGAGAPFEVIVVDDASPDDTADVLMQVDGLTLIRHSANVGFVGSCNDGAATARGEFLLFLNNDTQVTPGWLDALLACFADHPGCGIAGSRLVYPDGRLQEAGALVFADGSGWNVGRFEPRDAAIARWRRRTDYVSGAALMIRRVTFAQIGGFDVRYAPGYYEDADLAFAVRASGLQVFYEPASVVVHTEGASAGTDPDAGMKRYQAINQQRFVDKWSDALTRQPPPGTPVDRAIHERRRGRILVADVNMPDPSRDSGSLRLMAILRLLDAQGWSVAFAPDNGRASPTEIDALGRLGVEVLLPPAVRNLPRWLAQHGATLSAVMLCRHTVAGQYLAAVRRHAPQAKLLFDTVDLHFLREQRAADVSGQATIQRQADASMHSELKLVAQSDVTFVVSPHERTLLQQRLPEARIELLSNIHSVYGRGAPFEGRRDLTFIGGWGHPPNADALRWLAASWWPALRTAMPDMRIHVLGDLPDDARAMLESAGLVCHGRVEDLAPWMDRSLASIAPLRFGAGVKGKINMAMSHGLPVIATTIAVEGMQLVDGQDVLVADDAASFVAAVKRLAHAPSLWRVLSDHGAKNIRMYFSAEAAAAVLRRVFD